MKEKKKTVYVSPVEKEKKTTRPREKKFCKVSNKWIHTAIRNLEIFNEDDDHNYLCKLTQGVVKWTQDDIKDKEFCARVFELIMNLKTLCDRLKEEKEVAEFIEDDLKYQKTYEDQEDPERPF